VSLGSTSKQRDVLLASSLAVKAVPGQLRRWRPGTWGPQQRVLTFLVIRAVPGHASLRGMAEIYQEGEVVSWSLDAVEEGSDVLVQPSGPGESSGRPVVVDGDAGETESSDTC